MKVFDITHAKHLHPPYGMWIVRHGGVEIGRQLSQPGRDDCERMLTAHREGKRSIAFADTSITKRMSYHLSGAEATLAAQRRGGYHKRGRGRPRKAP